MERKLILRMSGKAKDIFTMLDLMVNYTELKISYSGLSMRLN